MTLVFGVAGWVALFAVGVWLGVRFATADRRITHLIHDDAISREAERSERGLYARWWL